MFEEILSAQAKRDLEALKSSPLVNNFYLAGGTALALYLGHRQSFDLDFFSKEEFDIEYLIKQLSLLGEFSLEKKSWGTIVGILNKTKIGIFVYQYPLLQPLLDFENFKIASILDIACMKLDAAASRGSRRDFVDLYFVCKTKMSLPSILTAFKKKYAGIDINMMRRQGGHCPLVYLITIT